MNNCKECKGMLAMSAFSYSKCKACGCEVVTSHMPSYKYCKECAKALNICEQCGAKLEGE